MKIPALLFFLVAVPAVLLFLPRPKWVRARQVFELPEAREPAAHVRYSVLVPALREPYLDAMFTHLMDPGRRDFEVLLLVSPDDHDTLAQARRLEAVDPQLFRTVLRTTQGSRLAAALNEGLAHCAGEVVGFLEVDDPLAPGLIDRVDGAFRASGADVVRLAVDVPGVLEAGEIVHRTDDVVCVRGRSPVRTTPHFWRGHSAGYFVRTDLLRLVGGWDDGCSAEELELMLRLFTYGATGAVLYGEETRVTIPVEATLSLQTRMLYRRRLRRNTGLLQIYRTREWHRIQGRFRRWSARLALLLPLVRDLAGPTVAALTVAASFFVGESVTVGVGWTAFVVLAFVLPDDAAVVWLRAQTRTDQSWLRTASPASIANTLLSALTRTPAALTALTHYLRGDTPVLNAHFEHSLRKPPPRAPGPPPPESEEDAPADLLALASSPDTPAAAQALAAGLDTLFTALGPPPEAQRLAGTGPAPKGDGGADDG
ncbi:glycosyltransferase family 2 protein [Streptomyces roseirectus]|uniref:Glycosyltransferase family 2 protein n=1 Tax=Streptomyces roseirectus TaxID=2768066 RepID=A0A7H0I931_9ACTN|nr:glycosyltransferase family A protein [Streptomyces roseirectus]QNP69297.1 glycosyltransferase family 2 protein [Streptomyces roseirectus]